MAKIKGNENHKKLIVVSLYAGIALGTIAVFWQVYHNGFITVFDDNEYIIYNDQVNRGFTWNGILWAFTKMHSFNWHPLTWLSHMLDCQLFGLEAGPHHLINLFFHIVNSLLLFAFFERTTRQLWASAFVAAAFALHPLHVESVAWASERKDVLSTLFWLLTMFAYVRYKKRPNILRYLIIILFFCLGLLAKQMLVTIPFVLLLLDYWPLRRFSIDGQGLSILSKTIKNGSNLRCILEKIPLLFFSAAASLTVYLVQASTVVVQSSREYPFYYRIENAVITYIKYLMRMIWPAKLTAFYPHPSTDYPLWQVFVAAILLIAITVLIIYKAKQYPYLVTGWFWYLGTLVPVVGLVQVGLQASADRYTYMTLTGIFIIIAWGLDDLFMHLPFRKAIITAIAAAWIVTMGILTSQQVKYWKNDVSLHQRVIDVYPNDQWAYNRMGLFFFRTDKFDKAGQYFAKSLQIRGDQDHVHSRLGMALLRQNKTEDAVAHFNMALKYDPNNIEAHNYLGQTFVQKGDFVKAIEHYSAVIRIQPFNTDALNCLGNIYMREKNFEQAIKYFNEAVRIDPDSPMTHSNLGNVLVHQGKPEEAAGHFMEALRIDPDLLVANYNLGCLFLQEGKYDEASKYFSQALRIKPDFINAKKGLQKAQSLKASRDTK